MFVTRFVQMLLNFSSSIKASLAGSAHLPVGRPRRERNVVNPLGGLVVSSALFLVPAHETDRPTPLRYGTMSSVQASCARRGMGRALPGNHASASRPGRTSFVPLVLSPQAGVAGEG
jgi:hypothetical protein